MSTAALSTPSKYLAPKRIGRSSLSEAKHALVARENFMKERWIELLGLIREGAKMLEALADVGIDRAFLTKILRASPEARAAWEDAKLAGLWREWDIDTMEEILVEIAMGGTVKASLDNRGLKYEGFYSLIMKDPIVKEMYDDAQKIRMEGMADEIIEISDAGENDVLPTGRVNHEVVARDKLKTDNRKWLMARLHWKRFGDRLQTEQNVNLVVDHAGRLDAARKRKEKVILGRAEVVSTGRAMGVGPPGKAVTRAPVGEAVGGDLAKLDKENVQIGEFEVANASD